MELLGVTDVRRIPRLIRTEFSIKSLRDPVSIKRKGNIYVVETKKGSILPLPSKRPYKVVELPYKKYRSFKGLIDSGEPGRLEHLVNMAIATLASIEGFSTRTSKHLLFWERTDLVTPLGYADQYGYWRDLRKEAELDKS